jgi:hypothetical protein
MMHRMNRQVRVPSNSMSFPCRLLIALLVVSLMVGCGPSLPTVPVSGAITQNGKPVEGATVLFSPKDATSGKPASGKTDASGKYTLSTYLTPENSPQGALPGDYNVTVTKLEAQTTEMSPADLAKKMESAKGAPGSPSPGMTAPKNLLPERYSGATSGLTATVKSGGTNDFPFDLQDQ